MFGYDTRSRSDISDRIDALRSEIARLSEDMADSARSHAREGSKHARQYAHSAVDDLTDHAERLGARAGEMIVSGLAAARRGRREARRELDHVADRTQEVVTRHPAASTLAALGICLATVYMVSLTVRRVRRTADKTSSGGRVRRTPARASR